MREMFPKAGTPRVFGLPVGVDFPRALVDGLLHRLADHPPEEIARVEIFVNTERTRRRIIDLLCANRTGFLPRIRTLADIPRMSSHLPPAISPLRRRLELTQLVTRLIEAEPEIGSQAAAFDLADTLAALMDEMQGEGISPDAFDRIDPPGLSGHWQRSLKFLRIVTDHLAATQDGPVDPQARQMAAIEMLAADWQRDPPQHPILLAGSTGSRGHTSRFLDAVAGLPQGAVILPGVDGYLPGKVWNILRDADLSCEDHPQFGFARIMERLNLSSGDILPWHGTRAANPQRSALISLALRPAPVTDQWLTEGPELIPQLPQAAEKVTLLLADSFRDEALAIAVRLRLALGQGQSAALVTPDRGLTRRVSALMDHWRVTPDDSAGRPLHQTPPGVLIRLTMRIMGQDLTPVDLLAILKHPLCLGGPAGRGRHLLLSRKLEMDELTGKRPFVDWQELRNWADKPGHDAAWMDWLQGCLAPLRACDRGSLEEFMELHMTLLERLSTVQETGIVEVWEKGAGQAAAQILSDLAAEADASGPLTAAAYRAVLDRVMTGIEVPDDAVTAHSDVAIWGTLEARSQSADLVILGGLNEGIWPRLPGHDPWLNRAMRQTIGLPSPDRQIGLSAHDFQLALGATEVLLSRSRRDEDAPTVPSRWLSRLTNLLDGLGPEGKAVLRAMTARGEGLLARARAFEAPREAIPPAPRPAPVPPQDAHPCKLSVTQVEILIRDPYAIYARHVLKLRPISPPGRQPDALLRGDVNHKVLERFVRQTVDGLPPDAENIFARAAAEVLEQEVPWPSARGMWFARLMAVRAAFLETERQRRERGVPLVFEGKGARQTADGFTLSAKADRIDRNFDGTVSIYDYKSGAPPSQKEVEVFAVQVPLEAAIAAAGGFDGVAPAEASVLEIIGLGSDHKITHLDMDHARIVTIWTQVCDLIAHFHAGAGYPARTRPRKLTFEGDFDHLSRRGEWLDGDDYVAEPVA